MFLSLFRQQHAQVQFTASISFLPQTDTYLSEIKFKDIGNHIGIVFTQIHVAFINLKTLAQLLDLWLHPRHTIYTLKTWYLKNRSQSPTWEEAAGNVDSRFHTMDVVWNLWWARQIPWMNAENSSKYGDYDAFDQCKLHFWVLNTALLASTNITINDCTNPLFIQLSDVSVFIPKFMPHHDQ